MIMGLEQLRLARRSPMRCRTATCCWPGGAGVGWSGAHPVLDLRASAMAHRVAAACMVEELLGAGDRQATG